jgi:hypothetical protein
VSFAAITLCVVSQRVFIVVVYFVMTQSGNFWIHPPRSVTVRKLLKTVTQLSLCLTKHHARKTYGEVEEWLHVFLTAALDGVESLLLQDLSVEEGSTAVMVCTCIQVVYGSNTGLS